MSEKDVTHSARLTHTCHVKEAMLSSRSANGMQTNERFIKSIMWPVCSASAAFPLESTLTCTAKKEAPLRSQVLILKCFLTS